MNLHRVAVFASGTFTLLLFIGLSGCANLNSVPPQLPQMSSQSETPLPDPPTPQPTGISPGEASQFIPLAPLQVTARVMLNGIEVRWLGTGEDGIHYEIYRTASGTQTWQYIGAAEIVADNRGAYTFQDTTVRPGVTYLYGVIAVSQYGKQSALSQSNPVTVSTP